MRHAFTDERAAKLLQSEARQLPKHEPGLVMIATPTNALSRRSPWASVIEARLQHLHSRVSGVGLFHTYSRPTGDGLALRSVVRVIENEKALKPAPAWLLEGLRRYEHVSDVPLITRVDAR